MLIQGRIFETGMQSFAHIWLFSTHVGLCACSLFFHHADDFISVLTVHTCTQSSLYGFCS